jgi:hypothetical protein
MNAFFRWAKTLRFKKLFLLTLLLFIGDLLVPDFIPLIDELLLGLLTLLLGSIRNRTVNKEGGETLD